MIQRSDRKLQFLKSPKFWKISQTNEGNLNSWTNSFKGRVKWGYLYNSEFEICKLKNACNDTCKHRPACRLYTIVNDEGNDVITIQRVHVNARLLVRGTSGAVGYDLFAVHKL